jgi:allantoin racemase
MTLSLRLHVVVPVTGMGARDSAALAAGLGPGVAVTWSRIETGPASIESELDEALAAPDTIAKVLDAARSGAAAVVIDCLGDPGLEAAREVVTIPVLGSGQTSMHVAAMLGYRFSILTVLSRLIRVDEEKAARCGLASRLASVRSVDIPVLELEQDHERLTEALAEQGLRAVRDDGAHVIILGCTGMLGLADSVAAALAAAGAPGIPVVDPLPATLQVAAGLARLGLAPSRRTYPPPPAKDRPGYGAVFGPVSSPVGPVSSPVGLAVSADVGA